MDRDLTPSEFSRFHDLIYDLAGIHYPDAKTTLLSNRIRKRLEVTGVTTYDTYLQALRSNDAEVQQFLDSITTNETYFFRCERHWNFFRDWAKERIDTAGSNREGFRIWSAAASNGAEAYSIVITLHQLLGERFHSMPIEILGTDLSETILREARQASYRPYALSQTPPDVQAKYFTKNADGDLQFDRQLASVVKFERHNLMDPLPPDRPFDFVFLRNVMIYFDEPSKMKVLNHACNVMHPDGYLVVGESESLLNIKMPFEYVSPSVFHKPAQPATMTH